MLHAKALALLAVLLLASTPDEGQWLPSQIRNMDWDALAARGMKITKDEFWHPERGGLLNAAVQINSPNRGHCTASFISPNGLIITNHHCGDQAIAALSTLKHNYLSEGFVSRSMEKELPTDMVVHVVRRIEDVTDQVHAAQSRATTPLERYDFTQAEIQRLVAEGETDPATGAKDPLTTCHVASLFEGREYHLYYRTRIDDVRLVYAPPIGTADYGGNVDNWEWPRHSGDFVLFRAYVAPDGTPAQYAANNVPYRPKHHLKVAPTGVQSGDLVMILGYPGQTLRYLSSVAVQERQGFQFPKRRFIIQQIMDVLETTSNESAERRLRLTATLNSFANVEKNHLGMIEGLARNAVVDRKIREEEGFSEWAKQQGNGDFVDALHELLDLDHAEKATQEKDLVLGLMMAQPVQELLPLMRAITILAGSEPSEEDIEFLGSEEVTAELDTIQRPLLEVLFEELRNLPDAQRVKGSEVLADADVAADDMVSRMLQGSDMLSAEARVALARGGAEAVAESTDPMIVLGRGLLDEVAQHRVRQRRRAGRRMVVGPRWIEAQQAWRGQSFYPDANSTLRVSIAEVMGYSPRDAVQYHPFTTVAGMMSKHTGEQPFVMPDSLREAARRRWLSRFRSRQLGDIPVCFLANGDTTNGNSGSPVINGRGEFVGLNFDRVFENVAGDFGWHPDRSRNISLDVRFVLWHLESVMPSPRLLREMGVD